MINRKLICIIFSLITVNLYSQNSNVLKMTIDEAIYLARTQSPEIIAARHSFHSSYWSYCNFKANYLPTVSFSSTPNFNHQINAVTLPDGTSQFVQQNQLNTEGDLYISQNIALTGGSISLSTGLNRLDLFGTINSHSYRSNPVTLTYQQTLWGYNSLKWDKKTEPLRFEIAKKNYVTALERVSGTAISYFFNLAMAQANLDIAQTNYRSADTLYTFAEGRYKIGRITESEMLHWEVRRLNEETNLLNASLNVEDNIQSLRTFLGIKDSIPVEIVLERNIPSIRIDPDKALALALENNPSILNMTLSEINSESNVAYAKANSGAQATMRAQLGLSKAGEDISAVYKDPNNQQYAQIGISVPILDWGRGKGRVKVAESNRRLVEIQLEQERANFELTLLKQVRQFNFQSKQIIVAEKTDYTANKRNDVAQKLYVLGRSTIIELNTAIAEKDAAKRSYINTLYTFWSEYYAIRRLALYDFEKDIPLTEDYESLIK
ncbi:MAG: TolC family protein [Prevotellaceae bacterium]|jgi:outer membrane protein TolC|nr:TolC family protein [Prevotellaceae bacterium]